MAIGQEFSGLNMEQLIGGPLSAAANANTLMAGTTANFIDRVGFTNDGKLRTAAFGYQKRSQNDDGTTNLEDMRVEVPLLSIVPIPNLQVDEVNITFDMEVKQSQKSESSADESATVTASTRFFCTKVDISGSVSAHQSNTRSTDNSAKYHVDVRATNHGTPEGLARVLDMMAANVAPALIGSTLRDANGQALPDASKAKAERLKQLRQEISQIENRLSAAREKLDQNIVQLKRTASAQQNVYRAEMTSYLNGVNIETDEGAQDAENYEKKAQPAIQSWDNMQSQAAGIIQMIADSGQANAAEVSALFSLKAWKDKEVKDYAAGEQHYEALAQAQNGAVTAQTRVNEIEKELFDKKEEYSDAASGKAPAQQ
ncbi:MAG: DUF2589 domain-containing protein [Bacteroidales bacterium]|nr:DUF2589 domain-containing protein [Lachnoclostridium sp.]MCM1383276.1 DUF2589 domain-containing protein [Lachnoclostridium sp.]MCM1465764.1 DUF2589 domain-containing protein [Bacteroidales bacterium]